MTATTVTVAAATTRRLRRHRFCTTRPITGQPLRLLTQRTADNTGTLPVDRCFDHTTAGQNDAPRAGRPLEPGDAPAKIQRSGATNSLR
jgi:hypothetical protein